MLKRPLVIAAIAATVSTGMISTPASANDPILGALVGAGIGAAIGHNVHGRDGAWVGGALGAVAGASIAANANGYYDRGYYGPQAVYSSSSPAYYGASAAYYEPAPIYYAPAPVYYGPPARFYRPRPVYVQSYQRSYPAYGRGYERGRHDWRDNNGYRGNDGFHRSGY